jgi:cyclic GMP-AMP synthase DncV-like protein
VTVQLNSPRIGSLSSLLGHGLRSLDISEAEYNLAVGHYKGLGDTFANHWDTTHGDNAITPQGSFALGTVVRNIHRNDEIDLDAVAIRDIDKTKITQAALKEDAGVAVGKYARSNGGAPSVSECERCWTLHWSEMHLDLLPAIPNREPGQDGILITDRDVREWLRSNPTGYADWFFMQMREALTAAFEARSMQIDDVPEWQIKTTLQQTVQALKRHRDIYFADHIEDRPASIIITTLAAIAYTGGDDLYDVLGAVTDQMGSLVEVRNGQWWVANPVQSKENFADSWAKHPERAGWFFRWIESAAEDFNGFGVTAGLDHTVPLLATAFGDRVAKAASFGYGNGITHARSSQRLHVATGGALVAAPSVTSATRKVRRHGFEGGSAN